MREEQTQARQSGRTLTPKCADTGTPKQSSVSPQTLAQDLETCTEAPGRGQGQGWGQQNWGRRTASGAGQLDRGLAPAQPRLTPSSAQQQVSLPS